MNQLATRSFLALMLVGAACGPSGPGAPGRGVLVVAVDALRYDHLSGAGYDRDTTPGLSLFGRESITFDDAWSASSTIVSSHATLMTGCDPLLARRPPEVASQGSGQMDWIPNAVPRLAVEFVCAGWTTAAFSDHPFIGALRGFDMGFQQFFDRNAKVGGDGQRPGTCGKFERWIQERDADEDWFAYVQIHDLERLWRQGSDTRAAFEPRAELDFVPPCGRTEPIFHAVPPSRWRPDRTLGDYEALYDTGLTSVDEQLGQVLATLRDQGRLASTTVVITGSYGIGFGESGLYVASGSLSDVDLHVPLMIRPAEDVKVEVGQRIDTTIGLVDVAPTVLALSGLPIPAGMHGESLLPMMRGQAVQRREFVFATSGVYDGFAVISSSHVYEFARPAARKSTIALATSWLGVPLTSKSTPQGTPKAVEVLKDRRTDLAPGHMGRQVGDSAVAARMHDAAVEEYATLRRAQRAAHLMELDPTRVDPEDLRALLAPRESSEEL